MSSQCGICFDFLDDVQSVVATSCGHVYHSKCLLKWLDQSKTCPECRKKASKQDVVQLHFNFKSRESVNRLSLGNEIENLKSSVEERRREVSNLIAKNTELRKMIAKHETNISTLQQTNASLEKNLNTSLTQESRLRLNLKNAEEENVEYRDKVNFLHDIKTVVTGSQKDAVEILHQVAKDASSSADLCVSRRLAQYWSFINRELKLVNAEKNKYLNEGAEIKRKLDLTSFKLRTSKSTIKNLEETIKKLESTERENIYQSDSMLDKSFSPIPLPQKSPEKCPRKVLEMTPITADFEKEGKRKMKVVILSKGVNMCKQKRSISPVFHPPSPKRINESDSISRTGYDGLGGHQTLINPDRKKYPLLLKKKKLPKKTNSVLRK